MGDPSFGLCRRSPVPCPDIFISFHIHFLPFILSSLLFLSPLNEGVVTATCQRQRARIVNVYGTVSVLSVFFFGPGHLPESRSHGVRGKRLRCVCCFGPFSFINHIIDDTARLFPSLSSPRASRYFFTSLSSQLNESDNDLFTFTHTLTNFTNGHSSPRSHKRTCLGDFFLVPLDFCFRALHYFVIRILGVITWIWTD